MYSYDHKFIYVHIPKSGGTFIKHYLLSNIEPGYEENQNQQDYDDKYRTTCERSIGGILHEVPDYKNYFKFTVVRNPFDRVVSMFSYLGGWKYDYFVENNIDSPKMPYVQKFHDFYIRDDFDGFIDYAYEQKAINEFHAGYYETNLNRVRVRGRVEIDKFFKVEDMQECLFQLQMKLGFESRKGFDDWRKNSSAEYKKKKSYKEYYSTYSKDYIEKHFAEDLIYFNYGF